MLKRVGATMRHHERTNDIGNDKKTAVHTMLKRVGATMRHHVRTNDIGNDNKTAVHTMLKRVGATMRLHERTKDGLEMTSKLQYTQCWRELMLPHGSMRE